MGVGLYDALKMEATGSPSTITAKRKAVEETVGRSAPSKSKRRHAPKVRTGCLSCKRRRVKCDEAKPHCKRCLTSNTICDGYDKPVPPKALRLLMQRDLSAVSIPVAPSSKVQCQNEVEYNYFQIYKNETAPKLGGTFSTKIWDVIMLQASYEEPFVLSGLLAISASIMSKKATRESNHLLATEHNDFSFKQYEKALQGMANATNGSNCSRKAIIACLLVTCFESLTGNVLAALSQAQSGHDLLQEWLSANPYPNQSRVGISSPAPHIIEHELIQAAFLFDMQLLQHFDTRPVEVHQSLKHEGCETLDRMPHNFTDVDEAKVYWHLAQRRASHFIWEATACTSTASSYTASTNGASPYSLPSPCAAPSTFPESESDLLQLATVATELPDAFDPIFRYPTPASTIPDYHTAEHRKYSRENLRWRLAFSSLYSRLKKSKNPSLITAANILFIQSLSSEITLSTVLETSFDRHINDFREVVTIAKEVVEAKKREGHPEFVFEFGVTQALYTVARFCPEEGLKREAVETLRWFGCREGAWDCLLLVDMEMV